VATGLAEGKTVRDIAIASGRAESSIRTYLRRIHHKLGVSRRAHLVRLVLSVPGSPVSCTAPDAFTANGAALAFVPQTAVNCADPLEPRPFVVRLWIMTTPHFLGIPPSAACSASLASAESTPIAEEPPCNAPQRSQAPQARNPLTSPAVHC